MAAEDLTESPFQELRNFLYGDLGCADGLRVWDMQGGRRIPVKCWRIYFGR